MSVKKNIKTLVSNENTFVFLITLMLITLPLKHIVNSISIILFLIFTLAYNLIYKNKTRFTIVNFLFISIYVLAVLSLLWTINFDESIKGLQKMLSFLVIPLGFMFTPGLNDFKIYKVLRYFSYSMVLYALYCLIIGALKFLTSQDTSHLFYHSLSSPLNQINAIYLSVYIAFSLFFFIINTKSKNTIHSFSITVLMIFLILLSSKIIISFTFLTIVIYLVKIRYNLFFISALFIIITSLIFFMPDAKNNIKQRINNEVLRTRTSEVLNKKEFGQNYYWTGFGLRLFQAKSYFEMVNEDHVLSTGYGISASQKKLTQKYQAYKLYPGFYSYNFHNQYFQILAELGILGFLLLISIFFLGVFNSIKYKNLLFIGFNFLILFLCITESYLWRQRGMVFFITVFLLLYKTPSNFYYSKNLN